jgi:hypothetical protein
MVEIDRTNHYYCSATKDQAPIDTYHQEFHFFFITKDLASRSYTLRWTAHRALKSHRALWGRVNHGVNLVSDLRKHHISVFEFVDRPKKSSEWKMAKIVFFCRSYGGQDNLNKIFLSSTSQMRTSATCRS